MMNSCYRLPHKTSLVLWTTHPQHMEIDENIKVNIMREISKSKPCTQRKKNSKKSITYQSKNGLFDF